MTPFCDEGIHSRKTFSCIENDEGVLQALPKMSAGVVMPGIDILSPRDNLPAQVTSKMSISTSPSAAFHSSVSSRDGSRWPRVGAGASAVKHLKPFATEDIKILLLENVNKTGRDILEAQGYQVDFVKTSLPEDELIQRIRWCKP